MYSIEEYGPVLREGVERFGASASNAVRAMCGADGVFIADPPARDLLTHHGLTIFCNFFGSIQGIFLISIAEEAAHQILGQEIDPESATQVDEFFKEVLNIASGETLEYMESHFGQLTYFPAIVNRGHTTFPAFAASHVEILFPESARMQCCIFLNLAEVKLDAELKRMQQSLTETERFAHTDPLTGVYNRRYFEKIYAKQILESLNSARYLSILWIDVDFFKHFNDRFGHQIGDETLRTLGQAISQSMRAEDLAFRYGGDEFVLLLPDTRQRQATRVAEHINDYLRHHPVFCPGPDPENPTSMVITLSIGIAELRDADTPESFLKRADEMLYRAKARGRNCVICEQDAN